VLDANGAPRNHREGVLWQQPSQCDLLFISLNKSEALFSPSPSTRTRDLAIGTSLFHWESQSHTRAAASTGQRTIHHASRSSRVLLVVPEAAGFDAAGHPKEGGRAGGDTEPFRCLGFASYEGREGERILFVGQWRFAGGWSGRSRRRGCQAVAWHVRGDGGWRGSGVRRCPAPQNPAQSVSVNQPDTVVGGRHGLIRKLYRALALGLHHDFQRQRASSVYYLEWLDEYAEGSPTVMISRIGD